MSVKWSPEYDSAADAWFIRSDEQRPEGSTVAHVFTGEDDARLMASAAELRAEVERLRDEVRGLRAILSPFATQRGE